MMNFLYDSQEDIDKALKWLYLHEKLIDTNLRASSLKAYKFLSGTNPMVVAAQNKIGKYKNDFGINLSFLSSVILGISLEALSGINDSGISTAWQISMLVGNEKSIYVIRTITDPKQQRKGIATSLKRYFISNSSIEYKYIWGHHEQGSTMQHINLKLGAEEIMTEPKGWNGSDKTHILYRITL